MQLKCNENVFAAGGRRKACSKLLMRKVLIEHDVEEVHLHRQTRQKRPQHFACDFSWICKIFSLMTATKDSLFEDLLGNVQLKISLLDLEHRNRNRIEFRDLLKYTRQKERIEVAKGEWIKFNDLIFKSLRVDKNFIGKIDQRYRF